MTRSEIEIILQMALDAGADHARIAFSGGSQTIVQAVDDTIDTIQRSTSVGLGISLFVNGRFAKYATNRMDEPFLRDFISDAVRMTSLLEEDPFRMLPPRELCYGGGGPDLAIYDESMEKRDIAEGRSSAIASAREILGIDDRIISVETCHTCCTDNGIIADTNGFYGERNETSISLSSSCAMADADGSKPSAWWYAVSPFVAGLKSEGCSRMAYERCKASLAPRKLPAGRYNVILENTVSYRLLNPIMDALSGGAVYHNISFLKGRLGERIFPEQLVIWDNPLAVGKGASRLFDGEGLALRRRCVVEEGVPQFYYMGTYYAGKLGMEPTASDYTRLELQPWNGTDLKDIMRRVGEGILVTNFIGGDCNGQTGDFSYGIQGFRFEQGERIFPIREMNMTGNIFDCWNGLMAVGNDPLDEQGGFVPTLAFCGISIN